MSVLITNAESAKALVVARSLGRKKIPVYVSGQDRLSPTFFSKYIQKKYLYADPEKKPEQFIKDILRIIADCKPRVLIPINNTETLLLAKNRHRLPKEIVFPFDDYQKMVQLSDKYSLYKLAKSLHVPVPLTTTTPSKKLHYPLVLKQRNKSGNKGLAYIHNQSELEAHYQPHTNQIIQEYIQGQARGVSCLFNHGKLIAFLTHQRLREYPITGGPATYRQSIGHPEMEKDAIKLLKSLHWHGLAMTEFKYNPQTHQYYLIEVNPRVWGSINQGVCSGVDFPYLLYQMAIGKIPKPIKNYQLQVKTRFYYNDVRSILAWFWKTKKLSLLKELLPFSNGLIYNDDLSKDDPLPGIIFVFQAFKELIKNK